MSELAPRPPMENAIAPGEPPASAAAREIQPGAAPEPRVSRLRLGWPLLLLLPVTLGLGFGLGWWCSRLIGSSSPAQNAGPGPNSGPVLVLMDKGEPGFAFAGQLATRLSGSKGFKMIDPALV